MLTGAILTAWALYAPAAHGQAESPRPPQPRAMYQAGFDLFKRGDYEQAKAYYDEADKGREELTPREREELKKAIQRNGLALQARRDGSVKVRMAEDALRQGRTIEANNLIKLADTQYLAPADRQALQRMQERVRMTSGMTSPSDGPVLPPTAKGDYKALLGAARAALQRGDLEMADTLATQADRVGPAVPQILHPWSDSPARVRKDIQIMRTRLATQPRDKKDGSPLQGLKNMFSRPAPNSKDIRSEEKIRQVGSDGPMLPPPVPVESRGTHQESSFLPPANLGPRAEADAGSASPAERTQHARQLVRGAQAALKVNDLPKARELALRARDLRPDLDPSDPDNPNRLLAELQHRAGTAAEARTPSMLPDPAKLSQTPSSRSAAAREPMSDPRALLREARVLLKENKIDEAETLCNKAQATPTRWGLFEDSPDSLRKEINSARSRRDRDESARLLVEARKLYSAGRHAEAKTAAYRAQKLHGAYSVWELGDRPQRIISEVERLEAKQGKPFTSDTRLAQSEPRGPSAPSGAGASPATKQRAKILVAEARDLERKGRLIESRQKAMEAAQYGATFGPEEDSPQNVLASLASQCDRQVQLLLQRVDKTAASSDPSRFNKAEGDLSMARQLAHAFGQDAGRIDQKGAWLRNLQISLGLNPMSPPALAAGPPPEGKRHVGIEKLSRARLELKAGNTNIARALAEDLADPSFGIQTEAFALLRSIEVEERNQAQLTADRSAQAAVEAYKQRNYRMARGILATLDLRLVSPQMQAALREIGSAPEMQPTAVAQGESQRLSPSVIQTQDTQAPKVGEPGRAEATDFGPLIARPDPFDQLKAMEEVQHQQLRVRGLQAQNVSTDLATRGELQRAMDVLTDYLNQLGGTQLDPERLALLRRPVEMRLQNLQTIKAQDDLRKEQQQLVKSGHNESGRTAALTKNQEQVADLMKEYRLLHREGKLKDALAKARQAKELDPDNVAADAAIRIVDIQLKQNIYDLDKSENEKTVLEQLRIDYGADINLRNPVKLDADAIERAKKRTDLTRLPSVFRNPRERQIEQQLSLPVTINVKDLPLEQALQYLHIQTGVQIVPDYGALNEASISLQQPATLEVENISLRSALTLLLRRAHLTYLIKEEVLLVTTEQHAKGKYKTVPYPVADLVVPVDNHPTPSVFSFQAALERHIASQMGGYQTQSPYPGPLSLPGGQTVGSSGVGSQYTPGGGPVGNGPVSAAAKRLPGQTMEDLLMDLIKNTIAPSTWRDVAGEGTIQYYPLGMVLVVNQTQEVQEEVFALLQSLRRLLDLEVAIELKLVSVSESFFERLGVDFDITFLTNNKRYESQLLTGQFQPAGFINQFRPKGFVSGLTPAGTFTPDLNIPIKQSSFDFTVPPFGGYPGTIGADGGLSLGLAFLSDVQVFMMLEAAQGDRRTAVMQAPKITVFNGQTATLTVTDNQFFLLGVTLNVTGFGNLFFNPTQTSIPTGVTLSVTPVVSADRRFVRLALAPTLTNLTSTQVPLIPVQIPVPQFTYGPGIGTTVGAPETVFQMFFQQPAVTTISVTTTVNVPDGGTVLMGGLKTLSEARNEFGPPILSKIPYISRLFRNIGYGREAQSLMIMVTPRIIIQEEEMNIYEGNLPPIPRF